MTRYNLFETAHGIAGIAWREDSVTAFRLPDHTVHAAKRAVLRYAPDATEGNPPSVVAATIRAATRYFAGERADFSKVAIDMGPQEPFFAQVYERVRRLGWGETITYGVIAKELGAGLEAARDVGQAMARNPVPLIVPCHRVLAAGGRIGGFSAPGGASSKARMLEMEGVHQPEPAQAGFVF